MTRTIRARYSKGMIEPLERLEIEEGRELTVTISESPKVVEGEDPLDLTSGGWAGLIDADELKKNSHRLISTRPRASLSRFHTPSTLTG